MTLLPAAPSCPPPPRRGWQRRLAAALVTGLLASGAATALPTGLLTICTDDAPEGFDIAQTELLSSVDATGRSVYDQLLQFSGRGLGPGLAERWDLSPDGRTLTLHLRRGVSFHRTAWFQPSRPMNADDVVFSLARQHERSHWDHGGGRGFATWAGLGLAGVVRSISKVDEHSVRITLAERHLPLLASLAVPQIGSVLSAEYAEQLRRSGRLAQLDRLPVGTGPFAFKSYQKDAVLRLVAHPDHPDHPRGSPTLAEVALAVTPNPDVRSQRLRAGECLMGLRVKEESANGLTDHNPRLQVVANTPLATTYLALNTRRGPLADRRVREALALSLDRRTLIRALIAGYAIPATSILPQSSWGRDDRLPQRPFDQAAARDLLQAAGAQGRELTLFTGTGSDIRRGAELLQADWARIGLKVRIVSLETGELYQRSTRGEHDILLQGWMAEHADPDNFLSPLLSCAAVAAGGNRSMWCDPRFDQLLADGRREPDLTRRADLYRQAQRLVHEQLPVIPLYHGQQLTVLDARVHNWRPSALGSLDLRGVWVDAPGTPAAPKNPTR